ENDTHGMNRIFVDGATGEVVAARALDFQPPGNRIYEWIYPLHTGTLVGWPYRLLLVLAGLAPLASLATGLILSRSRAEPGSGSRRRAARTPDLAVVVFSTSATTRPSSTAGRVGAISRRRSA